MLIIESYFNIALIINPTQKNQTPVYQWDMILNPTEFKTTTTLLSRTYIPSCKFWNSLFISSTISAYALVISATGLLGSTYLLSITF